MGRCFSQKRGHSLRRSVRDRREQGPFTIAVYANCIDAGVLAGFVQYGGDVMVRRTRIGVPTFAAMLLCMFTSGAVALDESKYPDLSGEWHGSGNRWPTNPPLTPEYQAVWEANKRDHS